MKFTLVNRPGRRVWEAGMEWSGQMWGNRAFVLVTDAVKIERAL